ncbi:hypothetical protein EMPS_05554 [Entomortierella parvispora]|uniref:Uncharacterized protein n=1 Tax=Entomortierella parvispora TaxID=205924 RepID=A0A9P3LWF2_9FUNG|nr:hypothetical protein EMPS_05554 [Entomortierella parvispora]
MAPIASIESILDIAPIRHRISVHLRQHDHAQAVRVNRSWNRALLPHLWSLLKGFHLHSFQSPEIRAALLRNGCHIRVLRTNTHEFLTYLGPACTNLVTFDFSGSFPLEAREDRSASDLPLWSQVEGQAQEYSQGHGHGHGHEEQGEQGGQGQDPSSISIPYHERALELMGRFLLQNQNLTTLSFRRCVDSRRYLDRLLTDYRILEQLPRLKDLTLTSKSLHSSALSVLLRHGQRLERLALKIRQIEWQIRYSNQEMAAVLKEPSVAGKTWNLRELQFGPIEGFDVSILVEAAGSSLVSLGLERLSLYEAQGLSKVVREHCPNLKHLVIRTDNKIDKNGLSLLLDAAAGATAPPQSSQKATKGGNINTTLVTPSHSKRDRVGLTDFQGHALVLPDFLIPRLFAKHYGCIEFLDLSRSRGIRSENIQRILCQCPNLRVLDMASEHLTLETKDILCGPRWACERLEILQVEIACSPPPYDDLPPLPRLIAAEDTLELEGSTHSTTALDRSWNSVEVQRQVLVQIGSFTRMQELMIGGSHGRSLDLTLGEGGGGLELLSGLKRMRNMNVKKMGHKAGQQELEWMIRQWPMVRLLMFQGYNPDMIDFDRLAELKIAGRKGKTATQARATPQ